MELAPKLDAIVCKPETCGLSNFTLDNMEAASGNTVAECKPLGRLQWGESCTLQCASGTIQTAGSPTNMTYTCTNGDFSAMPSPKPECTPLTDLCKLPDLTLAHANNCGGVKYLRRGQLCNATCADGAKDQTTGATVITYNCTEGGRDFSASAPKCGVYVCVCACFFV